jgi:hypothetical protein
VHLGQRLPAQRADVRQVLAELGWVLLGAPGGHFDQLRHLAEAHRVLRNGLVLEDGRHQPRLVVDQHELGLRSVEQHERILSWEG